MTTKEKIIDYLSKNPSQDSDAIAKNVGVSKSTVYKYLRELIDSSQVTKSGQAPNEVYYSISNPDTGDKHPIFTTEHTSSKVTLKEDDPPLIQLEVTNPITYLKLWWKKVVGNEGITIKFSFKIKPLTAMALTIIILSFGFGLGRATILEQTPIAQYLPAPTPTPVQYQRAAFSGVVKYVESSDEFYLLTSSTQAVRLVSESGLNLGSYINSRVFISGEYSDFDNTLHIADSSAIQSL